MNPCKRWWGYKHDWHKALYSEYAKTTGRYYGYHDAQLYGTKQCEVCGVFADGWADKDHPKMNPLTQH